MDNKNFELDDMELAGVVGGVGKDMGTTSIVKRICEKCNVEREFRVASGGRGYCMVCNHQQLI